MGQASLFDWSEDRLGDHLAERLGVATEVRFTRARSTPVRARQARGGPYEVHLHRMFRSAPDDVVEDLLAWLRHGRRARAAGRRLDAFLEQGLAAEPAPDRARVRTVATGDTHDLARLSAPLWDGFLQGALAPDARPALTWGRRGRSRTRHTLRLGSYAAETHLVRMHRVLDQPAVPDWFVTTVLVHELLHAALPPLRDGTGRWIAHHAAFRAREARWPDHERARAWERQHLPALIRSARAGTPIRCAGPLPLG